MTLRIGKFRCGWFVCLYFIFPVTVAFHNGAPCSAQYTMSPSMIFHGVPQNQGPRPPPYEFEVLNNQGNLVTKYNNEEYTVRITGIQASFRGFLLQVRPASPEGHPIGHLRAGVFVKDSSWTQQGIKLQPCPGVFDDSLTHATNDDRSTLQVKWKPTQNYGPVLFMITIVQNRTLFWTQWLPSTGLLFPEEAAKFDNEEHAPGQTVESSLNDNFTQALPTASPDILTSPAGSGKRRGSKRKGHKKTRPTTTQGPVDIPDDATATEGRGNTGEGTVSKGEGGLAPVDARPTEATPSPFRPPPAPDDVSPPPVENGPSTKLGVDLLPAAPAGSEEIADTALNRNQPLPPGPPAIDVEPPQPQATFNVSQIEKPELPQAVDYCGDRPCLNNGTCINVPEEERYDCQCTKQWTGSQCTAPNPCYHNKCKNGAACVIVNGEDRYTCKCTNDWGGEFCDQQCPSNQCQNGGTCLVTGPPGFQSYSCNCAPGWTGDHCTKQTRLCDSNPCLNNATCINKFNAFECRCTDGFMGDTCHRPCQNIYRSCEFWGEQEKCESQRPATRWFDINCARTCDQCKFDNNTVILNITLPPLLEPFQWILGRWTLNTTSKSRYPIDFLHDNSAGYNEEIVFSVAEVPQFGPPSINFSSIAINNLNKKDIQTSVGFLTVKPATTPLRTFLMTTGNDGITVVEEGILNGTLITLSAEYFATLPSIDDKGPATSKRSFSMADQYLKMDVERTSNSGEGKEYFTNYYFLQDKFPIF